MKIAVISDSVQATLIAALECYRKEVEKHGQAKSLVQINQAFEVLCTPTNGQAIAKAAKEAGIVYTDFANHGYGHGVDHCFVSAARSLAKGDLDFDDMSVVSQSGRGAHVSCWVWVSNAEAGIPDISDLLEEVLGHLGKVERDAVEQLGTAEEQEVLRHKRNVVEDLVVNLSGELDELCACEEALPESIVHKVYNLGSGDVETFPSCILKDLSAVAAKVGFDAVKVGHLNDWINAHGRRLDLLVTNLPYAM